MAVGEVLTNALDLFRLCLTSLARTRRNVSIVLKFIYFDGSSCYSLYEMELQVTTPPQFLSSLNVSSGRFFVSAAVGLLCSTAHSGLSSSIRFPGETALALVYSHQVVERCWPPFSNPDAKCAKSKAITPNCPCHQPTHVYHNQTSHFSCRSGLLMMCSCL